MKLNDPRRNLIQTWHWGDHFEIYVDPRKAPRWVLNRGALFSPCDVAGCQQFISKGDWYVRHPFLGVVCAECAETFGAVRGDPADRSRLGWPR